LGNAIHVADEEALRVAVNDAENGKPVTIVFHKDISLTDSSLDLFRNYYFFVVADAAY
jgi:hypothetical protein